MSEDISFDELEQLTAKYNDLGEELVLYNGAIKLRFKRDTWTYYLILPSGELERQGGVTSTCKRAVDKSTALIGWAKKLCLNQLRTLLETNGYIRTDELVEIKPLTYSDLDAMIKEAKRANDDALEDAGDIGHQAHSWIEDFIKTCISKDQMTQDLLLEAMPLDNRAESCCRAFLMWSVAHNVRWIMAERVVYSRKYKYAGTLDGLARVDSCSDPLCCNRVFKDRLSIVDHKTSNGLYLEYKLQTAAYWQAISEELGLNIEDRWINRFGKEDGEFESWHMEGLELFMEDFTAFIDAHNLVASVNVVEERLANETGMRKAHKLAKEKAEREAAHRIACPKSEGYKGVRLSRCFDDGTQCLACAKIYAEKH